MNCGRPARLIIVAAIAAPHSGSVRADGSDPFPLARSDTAVHLDGEGTRRTVVHGRSLLSFDRGECTYCLQVEADDADISTVNFQPPQPPQPLLPPSIQTPPPIQQPPVKSGRRKTILIGMLAAGCLISVGAVVGAAVGSSNDETEAEATVTTVDGALGEAFQAADDSLTPPVEDNDEVAEYGDEIGALLRRALVVINGITDTAQSAGDDDLDGWIRGSYGSVTVDQWVEATAIYDAWLEVEVPSGYDDVDDATGAVFRSLVDTTDDFSDSALAGSIDEALPLLELALDGMSETNLLIDTAQDELDRL